MNVRMLTKTALLCAAALILGYIDSLIPLVPGVPGIKLGLSNLALLYAVFYLSPVETVLLMILKVTLSNLLFGSAVSEKAAPGICSISATPVRFFSSLASSRRSIEFSCLCTESTPLFFEPCAWRDFMRFTLPRIVWALVSVPPSQRSVT